MLIKEYRICMPMPVEEYRIGQLYMIMKKSREESEGTESGVEIIKNEPYTDGPGGKGGQYTNKVYHVGKHLPSWLRSLFPKSALSVYEEAWNAYPYTMTRFRTPLMEKFQLDIESRYLDDAGDCNNAFNLSPDELRQREVVYIDIVKDHVSDYHTSEDPKLYKSTKTGRGPLEDNWRQEYKAEQDNDASNSPNSVAPKTFERKRIMCAYKLCRVEFKYWGMQTRVENFICEYALRKTLIRAHRQAWCWQDEYIDLSIEDIRRLEGEVQKILATKMRKSAEDKEAAVDDIFLRNEPSSQDSDLLAAVSLPKESIAALVASRESVNRTTWSVDDEFFDAEEELPPLLPPSDSTSFSQESKYNSPISTNDTPILFICLITENNYEEDPIASYNQSTNQSSAFSTFTTTLSSTAARFAIENQLSKRAVFKSFSCPNVTTEVLSKIANLSPRFKQFNQNTDLKQSSVLTAGSFMMIYSDLAANKLKGAVDLLTQFTEEAANECLLAFPENRGPIEVCFVADGLSSVVLYEALTRWPNRDLTCADSRSRSSSNLPDFTCETKDSVSSPNTLEITNSLPVAGPIFNISQKSFTHISLPTHSSKPDNFVEASNGSLASSSNSSVQRLVIKQCFIFGSPLGLVLAHRLYCCMPDVFQPNCAQIYNVFYEFDPFATRIEPLLLKGLGYIGPAELPRLHNWTWSHQNYYVKNVMRSLPSHQNSGLLPITATDLESSVNLNGYWGSKRIDYLLGCSQTDVNNRIGVLCELAGASYIGLLQASYWENKDLAAFILQEVFGGSNPTSELPSPKLPGSGANIGRSESMMDRSDLSPRAGKFEKWLKPHRLLKLRRPDPNHHASDVCCLHELSNLTVSIQGRMAYGAMDMLDLNGERVDCHIETNEPLLRERTWHYVGTNTTDEAGRVVFSLSANQENQSSLMSPGFHRVLLVVRGDHSIASMTMALLPPSSKIALFSIDGSFSASLSLSGANPRLHPGCVDVVKHWAQAGYIIYYISSRPSSQQNQVTTWLAKHNFPIGLMAFPSSGISSDPFRYKATFIRQLMSETKVEIAAAYGSAKDVSVYAEAGIENSRMFIIGRSKRLGSSHPSVNWLSQGYADHLRWLVASGYATMAPQQQWTLLRRWWSGVMHEISLVDGFMSSTNTVPPSLVNPKMCCSASQLRYVSIAKDTASGRTVITNILPTDTIL